MLNLKGLATGIGSLPHKDAQAALDLIFKYCPEIPFWPQLPKRDTREGMIAQFSENLPCLALSQGGLVFRAAEKEKELERFYEKIISEDLEYFKITEGVSLGLYKFHHRLEESDLEKTEFIKCHITGPFTFAASIKDEHGVALLHDAVFMQAIIKGMAMKALWQARLFEKFGKKIIMFLDEPYLGCFGSAYTPINREDVVKGLREFSEGIQSRGVLLGVHCCGNTDWSIFMDVPGISIINFDAFGFLDKFILYADSLKKFIEREGIVCWGIVPTQEFSGQEKPDLLVKKINDGIDLLVKKGLNRGLLVNNLLVSPSCGLGALDSVKSEKIFSLLAQASSLIKTGLF